jgi:hypothetical protein
MVRCQRATQLLLLPPDGGENEGGQQIFNHQLCDEASNKGSQKQQGGRSQNGVKDARNAETAEKGMSGKAKMKRQAQAMLRYWLRRAAHPQSRMRPGCTKPMVDGVRRA